MSHVRRIRLIKDLTKKLINLDAGSDVTKRLNCQRMAAVKNAGIFKQVLQALNCKPAKNATLCKGGDSRQVDARLDDNTGFILSGEVPEIVTADPDNPTSVKTMKRVHTLYLFYQAKESLIRQGFIVTETEQGDKRFLVGEKIEDDKPRIVEVCLSGDDCLDIESKSFDDAESCKKIIETVTADIDSDMIEIDPYLDNCTYDFKQKAADKTRKKKESQTVVTRKNEDQKHHTHKNR